MANSNRGRATLPDEPDELPVDMAEAIAGSKSRLVYEE